ncbi:MAG: hypothetical protein WCF46_01285 [Nitrososphaeraceae archaeon]|jgi:hypothetical protein
MIEKMKTKRIGKALDTYLGKKLDKICHIFISFLHKRFDSIENNKENDRKYLK